jgi:hypothetical protein
LLFDQKAGEADFSHDLQCVIKVVDYSQTGRTQAELSLNSAFHHATDDLIEVTNPVC